jgi:type IV pilus assembly protein PilW
MSRMRKAQTGFTLTELMVGMALGLMMTAAIITVFARSSQTSAVTQSLNEMQEQGRVALDVLQRDLRMAGFVGCNSNRLLGTGSLRNFTTNPTGYLERINEFMLGHEGQGSAFSPALPAEVSSAVPAPSAQNDVLSVRIAAAEPQALTAAMPNGAALIPAGNPAVFAVGAPAVISNCDQASAFVVTGVAAGVAHDAGANAAGDLGIAYGTDALVMPFQTVTYYIADAPSGNGDLSLWRRVDLRPSEEVATGVEQLQLQYGVDTDADFFADLWTGADAVPSWAQVVAVRVSLLLRSAQDRTAVGSAAYDFNGQVGIVPPDQRVRRPINVTIQLRNRTV